MESKRWNYQSPRNLRTASNMSAEHHLQKLYDSYFACYTNIDIHQQMLKDRARTQAYQSAFLANPQLFQDKTVLDVGAGTLILSMLAVKAGAKLVYAVEKAGIGEYAEEIIKRNGMEGRIVLYKQQLEEIYVKKDMEVDVIISEWMGYCLFNEAMIQTLIYARDHWLKLEGTMFPCTATLYMGLAEYSEFYRAKTFWENCYGFDMSVLQDQSRQKAYIESVPAQKLVSQPTKMVELDLNKVERFYGKYLKTQSQFVITKQSQPDCLVAWFQVTFPGGGTIDTSPLRPPTHWKQTVLLLSEKKSRSKGTVLENQVEIEADSRIHRGLKFKIVNEWQGEKQQSQTYFMV